MDHKAQIQILIFRDYISYMLALIDSSRMATLPGKNNPSYLVTFYVMYRLNLCYSMLPSCAFIRLLI